MPETPDTKTMLEMAQELEELYGPRLTGPCMVTLNIRVEEDGSPQEAVALATKTISDLGFDTFFFSVIEEQSEEVHYVRSGQVVDMPEALAAMDDAEDDDDEEDDEEEDDDTEDEDDDEDEEDEVVAVAPPL